MNSYVLSLIALSGIAVIYAVGLNIIMGFCGQVSLGHAAFVGIGAYGAALLLKAGAPLLIALGLGTAITCFFGLIVGFASIRLREDFLAITTLAVGFLFLGVVRKSHLLGGEFGLSEIPHSNLGATGDVMLIAASAVAAICVGQYIGNSWAGLAFSAIKFDEDAPRSLGISAPRYKLLAFCTGTAFAGLAGALYVNYSRFVLPDAFGFPLSVTALAMVVVGGIGSTFGVAFGALALVMLPELFRQLGDYRMLAFGSLLVTAMLFAPQGVAGLLRSFKIKVMQ